MGIYIVLNNMDMVTDWGKDFNEAYRKAEVRAKENLGASYYIAKMKGKVTADTLLHPSVMVNYERLD